MKIEKIEVCDCHSPEIKQEHPKGCTLNQIIKCHGDQPINELLKHVQLDDEKK
jgi:hypothetical protein